MALVKHKTIRNKKLHTPYGVFKINAEGVVVSQSGSAETPGNVSAYLNSIPGFEIGSYKVETSKKTPEPKPEPATKTEETEKPQGIIYEQLSAPQLKKIADGKGIDYAKNAGKSKMIQLLTESEQRESDDTAEGKDA